MKVIQGLIIFLGAVAVILSIGLVMITSQYINLCKQVEADNSENKITELIQEKEKLLLENITLQERNDELYSDNVKLTAAIKELRKINKELMNYEAVQEIPAPAETVKATGLLPKGHTNTFRCEDFHLFHPNSDQYKLQEGCTTDITTGIRILSVFKDTNKCDQYFCAAMATAYGTEIGQAYRVTLECGNVFNIILADFKHPIDNIRDDDYGDNDTNYDGEPCTNVIEFVVDMDSVPDKVKQAGTMSALAQFGVLYGDGGDIVKIEYLGRMWEP